MSSDLKMVMGLTDWFRERFGAEEEEPEIPERACDRCGFGFPETSMVIHEDNVLCEECLSKNKREQEEAEFRRKQAQVVQRMKYYCYDCKFHFSRKKEFPIRLCPNCGSENFVEEGKLM